MSETNARDISQRLSDIHGGLDALLATYDDDLEKLGIIRTTYQLVDHLQTLAPNDVDGQMLDVLEATVHGINAANASVPPPDDISLGKQGLVYMEKFERFGDLQDLDRAITSQQRAVDLTPEGHPNEHANLSNLGSALLRRFMRVGSLPDLEAAISRMQEAVDLILDDDPDKPGHLSNLGTTLLTRFEQTGSLADLEASIAQHQKAVDLAPDGRPSKPMYLSNLGNALRRRFDQCGSLADLESAVSEYLKAVDLTPDDHPNKPMYLNNLGSALLKRFQQVGAVADLEDATLHNRKAVNLTPTGHPDEAMHLDSLGSALRMRFSQRGLPADLEDAILQKKRAVDLTPDGHPAKPVYLNNLGNVLQQRFDRHGSLSDLEDAIEHKRKAVNLIPDGHPNKAVYLRNLGVVLEMRFDRCGLLTDLEDAIEQKRKAVDLTPDNHPEKADHLSSLATALETRFRRDGSHTDLEEAILQQCIAVSLTPDDHINKPRHLSNLGSAWMLKFLREGNLDDLDDAVIHTQRAIELMPTDHPDRAVYLTNLSQCLRTRFERLGDPNDIQTALSVAQESAGSMAAASKDRLQGALAWAQCCALVSASSLPAFECAIKLLPRMAWQGLAVDDQYFLLAESGSTARNAVAAAIEEDDYTKAVEWAEQGRSIVWQNLLSLRTPLDALQNRHPELAVRLRELSQYLEQSAKTRDALNESTPSSTTGNRMSLAIERDKLIDEARRKPGFENFMRPKSLEQLYPAARDGVVVFLNLGEARCDALALLSDNKGASHVVCVPLERVTLRNAEQLSQKLVDLLSKTGIRARGSRKHRVHGVFNDKNAIFSGILKTLWLDYVQPIINRLAYKVNVESPPRLWWCTTGPGAFLPLHAAGIYDSKEAGRKLSDYVVSSYTPTITALFHESSPISPSDVKILAVAVSNTPGAPLPCTEEEARSLQRLAPNLPLVCLTNGEATQDRVLEELGESTWAHLACHGEQVGGKPMESGLLLHDGKLKLSEIVKARLPNAEFAFLSACQTAVGDGGVPEESAHLAAGMLFAGYRGVVATMWSIQDDIAPRVAEDFYRYMFRNGQPKAAEVAYALHRAIRSLQESGVPFTSWVPFIHVGR